MGEDVIQLVAALPTTFTDMTDAVWSGIGEVVTTITSSSLLLLPVALALCGGVIGLAKSLMGTRRRRR